MVYYPLSVLMLAGIREVLVINTPHEQALFQNLLGDGSRWGMDIQYAIQPSPDGLAQALVIGEQFLSASPSCLVLGDNIFYGHGLYEQLRTASQRESGATVFGYRVNDPERYGVAEFGSGWPGGVDRGEAGPAEVEVRGDGALFLRRTRPRARGAGSSLLLAASSRSRTSIVATWRRETCTWRSWGVALRGSTPVPTSP